MFRLSLQSMTRIVDGTMDVKDLVPEQYMDQADPCQNGANTTMLGLTRVPAGPESPKCAESLRSMNYSKITIACMPQ
jgi:hypothetical protein